MKKVLIICGPTATGKSNLANKITSLFPSNIISADSRQVYIGTDIVTGKDKQSTYGIDLVQPNKIFSVSQWRKYALQKIAYIHSLQCLPIVVGGTGLYISSLDKQIDTIDIPPNPNLRNALSKKSVTELFSQLGQINAQKAASLNNSDRSNPHRLIRAIEISLSPKSSTTILPKYDFLKIGLICSLDQAEKLIKSRIEERIKNGAAAEYASLTAQGYSPDFLSRIAPGYAHITNPQKWLTSELQLFRRQKTWFKKMSDIHWFDIGGSNYQSVVIRLVGQWYSKII